MGKDIHEFFDHNTRLTLVEVNPFVIYLAARDTGLKDSVQSPHSVLRYFWLGTLKCH